MSLAVIEPKAEYDRKNEAAFREEVRKLGGNAYDRRGDVVVPFGKRLAFTSAQGQTIYFGYNTDGNFTIQQDASTPFGLASLSYVSTVQSDLESSFASLETSLTADFGDLSASFTTIATAFADIETAFASLEVDVEAANDAAAAAASSALAASASQTAAGSSASAAATSATNASTSASNASTSASQASTSETNAAGSAATATTQASNAATSATNASNSASAAAGSASTASTQATNAGNSASAANTSATNAATQASNAATSASAASTSAGNAATSASAASTSASNAAGSAAAASTSQTAAAGSATSAGNSATAASTSESNAATSATNAGNSASSASTSATNAASSQSAAAGSASAASTSASTASTQASNAATSASAAQSSQVSASVSAATTVPATFSDASQWTLQNATISAGALLSSGATNYGIAYGVGYLPLVSGHTYAVTARHRVTADGTNNYHYIGLYAFNDAGTLLGQYWNGYPTTAAEGWQIETATITAAVVLAAYPTATRVVAAILMNYNNVASTAANATCECSSLALKDVTESTAAAVSASAAATSASSASASQSAAGTSASAAATSATTATTQASNAATSATSASTSAGNAATSASTATTQASNAAASASTATTQASNASASASSASTNATLSAQYAAATGGSLLPNSFFNQSVSGGAPTGWTDPYGNGASLGASTARIDGAGGTAFRHTAHVSAASGIALATWTPAGSLLPGGKYKLRVRGSLVSGSWQYAVPIVYWGNAAASSISTDSYYLGATADTSGITSNSQAGLRTWEVAFTAPALTSRAYVYLLANAGSGTTAVFDWHECSLIPMSSADASVVTNASAIATVDGKLSASYGLTVDANGRIASMKLLSNGTTSSVKFTASTFSIYDGSSDVAMFEVSGGAAYVAGSKVRTESMAANSVSSGVANETDAAQAFDQAWTTIASVSVTTPDANSLIYLPYSMYIESVGFDATLAEARILRGATNIYQTFICGEPPTLDFETPVDGSVHYAPTFNGQVAGFDTDAPGAAGTYTYYLQCRTNGTGSNALRYWSATNRRLFALLFKR